MRNFDVKIRRNCYVRQRIHLRRHITLLMGMYRSDPAASEYELSSIECLSGSLRSIAADSTQSSHRKEGFLAKPAPLHLAGKVAANHLDLLVYLISRQGHEDGRPTEITIIFGNFGTQEPGDPGMCCG